jgi:hypothetical protein
MSEDINNNHYNKIIPFLTQTQTPNVDKNLKMKRKNLWKTVYNQSEINENRRCNQQDHLNISNQDYSV